MACTTGLPVHRERRPMPLARLAEHTDYLTEQCRRLLQGCRVPADDGTVLYVPDGRGNYKALWTRDFAYMLENAGHLIPPQEAEGCIRFLLRGQRSEGVVPDRVRPDGVAIYVGGPEDAPLGEPNLDNGSFLVIAVDEYLRRLPAGRAATLFGEWSGQLGRGLDAVPRSGRGLVYNDPTRPHSPYGFTDTVAKTGELFMESLLYWTACRRLATWHEEGGDGELSAEFHRRARSIEQALAGEALWDEEAGAFYAATLDCRQLDVWGAAYALYLGFPLAERRERLLAWLADGFPRYAWQGQVRHLPAPEHWQRLLADVPPETYQNGAYWATASGWVAWALAASRPDLAQRLLDDLVADFRQHGIFECVNRGYAKLDTYVVSATNPLGVLRRLWQPSL
ncbi:MAG: MGH1-like glycoside hydrolase domain-containing protein [Anaerolineae bacterium]